MRVLLLVGFLLPLAGCLWDDTQPQTPPKECVVTVDPQKCNRAFSR